MIVYNLSDMFKGWFVGDFKKSAYRTSDCEVAVKSYSKGDVEDAHYHKIATEITLIQSGKVIMFDRVHDTGDIIVVEPGDVTAFLALEDTITIVVKVPSVIGDKYNVELERLK